MARLLVVEDDTDARDMITMRLLLAGHRVLAEPDAVSALETMGLVGAPDVYLLDVGLPGMDGFELLGQLRARTERSIPAIFLSARSSLVDLRRGWDRGALYLTKPFRAQTLIGAVASAAAVAPKADPFTHGW